MVNEAFNLSLRKFLKRVGISSQEEIERLRRQVEHDINVEIGVDRGVRHE